MKNLRFLFVMFFSGLLISGTSFAGQSAQAWQQSPAQDSEKASEKATDAALPKQSGPVRGTKDTGGFLDQKRKSPTLGKKPTPKGSLAGERKSASTHPLRTVRAADTPSLQPTAPAAAVGSHPSGAGVAPHAPKGSVSDRNLPSKSLTAGLTGQQFKNSREPGARLAVSGGPQNSTKGTAAISGTGMKPKP